MVKKVGAKQYSQGNPGGDIVGGQDKAYHEGQQVGDGRGEIRVIHAEGWICGDGNRRRPYGRRTPHGGGGRRNRLVSGDRD